MSEKQKEKYPAMSPEDIKKEYENQDKAKVKYSLDAEAVEQALTSYMEQLDPILWKDPKDGLEKAIAWVCRPTMKQLRALIPPEMAKYLDDPTKAPEGLQKKYEKFFFEKMAELIAVPKKTADEWEEKANPWFVRKFWEHIGNIAKLQQEQVEGF